MLKLLYIYIYIMYTENQAGDYQEDHTFGVDETYACIFVYFCNFSSCSANAWTSL